MTLTPCPYGPHVPLTLAGCGFGVVRLAAVAASVAVMAKSSAGTLICAPVNGWKGVKALQTSSYNGGILGPARVLTDDCIHDAKALNKLVDDYQIQASGSTTLPWHEPLFSCHIK